MGTFPANEASSDLFGEVVAPVRAYGSHESSGVCQRVIGYVENGRACRACNGHGRDPS